MSGFIYAIRCGEFVKLGYATNPWKRRLQIRLCNPYPCEMLGFSPGTLDDEKALHSKFAEYRHRGEWFRFEGPVAEFVSGLENRETRYDRRKGPRTPEQIARTVACHKAANARRDELVRIACERHTAWVLAQKLQAAA